MKLKNRRTLDGFIPSEGPIAYVFWIGGCFDPATYVVRGEDWHDAWDYFINSDAVEPIREEDCDAFGPYETFADLEAAYEDGDIAGLWFRDRGDVICTDWVDGMSLRQFASPYYAQNGPAWAC